MPPPQHPQSRSHSYPSATTSHSTHTSAKFAPVPHSSFGGDHLIHEIGDRSLHDGNWLGGITIFVTTANALFGISVFTIPWGFQRSGIILGCGLTILVAWISFETSRIVLTAQSKLYASTGHVYSYPEISNEYLGSPFGALVKTSTVVSCFGGCIGSLIFSAGLLSQLLGITAQDALIYYCFLPLVLLSWIRSFKELTIFSVFGCVAIIASVVTLIIDGYSQRTYTSFPPLPLTHIIPSLSFIGPLTFLFTIHYIILSIGKEFMLHDQRSRVHRALPLVHGPAHEHNAPPGSSNQSLLFYVKVAYVFTVIVLCALGILGVILYRHSPAPRSRAGIVFPGCEDGICDNILLHITHGRTRDALSIALVASIILGYIVLLTPAREHIELALFRHVKFSSRLLRIAAENAVRLFLVSLTIIIAVHYPYFGVLLGSVGGLTDTFQSYIVPSLICLRIHGDSGENVMMTVALYKLITCFGALIMLYTLGSILMNLLAVPI